MKNTRRKKNKTKKSHKQNKKKIGVKKSNMKGRDEIQRIKEKNWRNMGRKTVKIKEEEKIAKENRRKSR